MIIAIPARRMDGMYYALLTLGVSEICRAYALQARWIGAQSQGSLSGGGGFIPDDIRFTATGQRLGYIAGFLLLLAALATYRIVNGQRLGLLLRASQKEDEAVSESMGIDFQRARLAVFLISSAGLGVIGAFYAGYFRAASLSLFGTDLLLLLFAMIVIGGIGRAEGAVVGTLVVTVIDRYFIDTGAKRILLVAILMLLSVLFTRGGAFGLNEQWQELRAKRRSERRASRSTRHGEVLPEEAPDIRDKSQIYQRRYDNAQREHLKSLITDDLIEEHRRSPTGPPLGEPRARDAVLPQGRPRRQVLRLRDRAVQEVPDRGPLGPSRRAAPRRRRPHLLDASTTPTTRCSCAASTTCAPPDP